MFELAMDEAMGKKKPAGASRSSSRRADRFR